MIPGGEMIEMIVEGEFSTMPSTLHHSDTLFQRGRYYSDEAERVIRGLETQRKIKGI
jgi:hypothetical protein